MRCGHSVTGFFDFGLWFVVGLFGVRRRDEINLLRTETPWAPNLLLMLSVLEDNHVGIAIVESENLRPS